MLMSGVQVHLPPPSKNHRLAVGFFLPLSPWPPVPLRWRGFRPWRDGRRWPRRPRIGAWGAWGGRSPVPCAAHCLFLQRTAVAQPPAMTRVFGPRSLQNMPHADDPGRTGRQGCCLPATSPPLLSAPQPAHTPFPAASIPRQTFPKASQQDIMNGSVCESRCEPSRQTRPASDHNAPPVTGQRKPPQTTSPALPLLAPKVLGRLEATTTIPALLLLPVLSLPCAALGATDPIGSGLAWLQSQILSDGQPSRTSALEAPTQARCETAKTLLRLLVSRHRSDVVGCAPPSERSARRIAQPIPSVLGKRCNAAMR